MGELGGFLKHRERELPTRRAVALRVHDWREVYEDFDDRVLTRQAGRCMDCGIPFCHNGCPLGNLIPEWNHLVFKGDFAAASERLHMTNNFPEFTGRLCPAPCEAACVLGINQPAVTIKQVEVEIVEHAFAAGGVTPQRPAVLTGKKVAVVGSGPAGLATAQQLTRAGHSVTVFERADRIGGLMRYGIPEFKMEKAILDRRLEQMTAEGTLFRPNTNVGVDVTAAQLREDFDAVVLAGGATAWRDLPVPGRELGGIHQAMEFLPLANKVQLGDMERSPIHVEGADVVVIGGGDTGADCIGTAHRQGARSVTSLEIMPKPPLERSPANPWPTWPVIYRVASAHEEGGERLYSVNTVEFLGDENGRVRALHLVEVRQVVEDGRMRFDPVAGSDFEIPAQYVFLAMGFLGPQREGLLTDLGVELDARGNVVRSKQWMSSVNGVFVAGDMGRGQSLIVWAIAEGRSCAAAVDQFLMGETELPAPLSL